MSESETSATSSMSFSRYSCARSASSSGIGISRAVVAPVALVAVGLHVDEVDHAGDVVLGPDRDLGGHDVRAEGVLEGVQRAVEVGALAVEHVDEDHARQVQLGRARPEALRGHLDAHHGVDDEDGGLAHSQRAQRVGDEARLARGVEEVDLALVPLERAQGGRDRHLARLLVGVRVRDRGPVGDAAEARHGAGLEEQRLVQGGLSTAAVADKGDVADAIRLVHAVLLS